jgi:hypothetical protein
MTYSRARDCVEKYAREIPGDWNYSVYLESVDSLTGQVSNELLSQLLEFLNKWGRCRLQDTRGLREELGVALGDIQPFLCALRESRIEDADLSGTIVIGDELKMNLYQVTHHCLDRLVAVGQRFSRVAAAKTLHALSPQFFVIWDSSIISQYRGSIPGKGCDGWFYAYAFLPAIQREIDRFVEDGHRQTGQRRETLLEELRAGFGFSPDIKTVAKRIDEVNWIRFTRRTS